MHFELTRLLTLFRKREVIVTQVFSSFSSCRMPATACAACPDLATWVGTNQSRYRDNHFGFVTSHPFHLSVLMLCVDAIRVCREVNAESRMYIDTVK